VSSTLSLAFPESAAAVKTIVNQVILCKCYQFIEASVAHVLKLLRYVLCMPYATTTTTTTTTTKVLLLQKHLILFLNPLMATLYASLLRSSGDRGRRARLCGHQLAARVLAERRRGVGSTRNSRLRSTSTYTSDS